MTIICGQEEREFSKVVDADGWTTVILPWNRKIAKGHCEFMDKMGIPKGFECNHDEVETAK